MVPPTRAGSHHRCGGRRSGRHRDPFPGWGAVRPEPDVDRRADLSADDGDPIHLRADRPGHRRRARGEHDARVAAPAGQRDRAPAVCRQYRQYRRRPRRDGRRRAAGAGLGRNPVRDPVRGRFAPPAGLRALSPLRACAEMADAEPPGLCRRRLHRGHRLGRRGARDPVAADRLVAGCVDHHRRRVRHDDQPLFVLLAKRGRGRRRDALRATARYSTIRRTRRRNSTGSPGTPTSEWPSPA